MLKPEAETFPQSKPVSDRNLTMSPVRMVLNLLCRICYIPAQLTTVFGLESSRLLLGIPHFSNLDWNLSHDKWPSPVGSCESLKVLFYLDKSNSRKVIVTTSVELSFLTRKFQCSALWTSIL